MLSLFTFSLVAGVAASGLLQFLRFGLKASYSAIMGPAYIVALMHVTSFIPHSHTHPPCIRTVHFETDPYFPYTM